MEKTPSVTVSIAFEYKSLQKLSGGALSKKLNSLSLYIW